MTKMEPLVNLCLQQNDLYNPFDDCWEILGSKDDGFGSKSDGHLRKGFDRFTNEKLVEKFNENKLSSIRIFPLKLVGDVFPTL